MSLFDNLGKTVSMAGQSAAQKTKDMADIAKLTAQNADLKNKLSQAYQTLGEQYMRYFETAPDEKLLEGVEAVIDLRGKIQENDQRIQLLRGMKPCPSCGEMVEKDAVFCNSCGVRLVADSTVVCGQCGTVLKMGTKFCTNCGAPLAETQSGSSTTSSEGGR